MILDRLCPTAAAAALALAGPLLAAPTRSDYERLLEHRLGPARPLAAGGLRWSLDATEWSLERGTIRLQEPVAGVSTGLWFEGRGTLVVRVPDPVELRQLRRLVGEPELTELATPFDRLLLRADGGAPLASLPPPARGGSPFGPYEKRHDRYLELRRFDADARVLAALADPGSAYWQADVRTPEHGWITVTFDDRRGEELSVERFDSRHDYLESWLSLDRAADRAADGRPRGVARPVFDVLHVDLGADLTKVPRKDPETIDGSFRARVDLEVVADGVSALPFRLHPRSEVTAVRDAEGRPLEFVRDAIGRRSGQIDNEIHDASLLVLLPEPLPRGARTAVVVLYELRLPKYASGRGWYPAGRDGLSLHDRHTARLELTTDERHDLQAMGRKVGEREAEGRRTSTWEIVEPAKMVTFAMQKTSYAKTLARPGLPELTTVGDLSVGAGVGRGGAGFRVLTEERVDSVAEGTARALDYLQQTLGPLPDGRLWAVLIPSPHGQAFAGFLHLGNFTAVLDTPAAAERFRAHEVAHQWWGHLVGWGGYRDQWLSEGFAEYLALMFVRDTLPDGDRVFEEAIRAYGDEIRGSIGSAFSSFARPGFALSTARGIDRIGPIGHGWRAGVGEAPSAYRTLAYYKGALVLHMLRLVCRATTGGDSAFGEILRDFVASHRGGYPSTEDFRRVVERRAGGDWGWFFDQWVYGAEIPTYAWSWEAGADGRAVRLAVERSDVDASFRMFVPVEIELHGGATHDTFVWIDEASELFELAVPSRPRRVRFNPGDAVIAYVKKR